MKNSIVSLLLLILGYSKLSFSLSDEEFFQTLNGMHGVNWSNHIKNGTSENDILKKLNNYLESPESFSESSPFLKNRAIGSFGHFLNVKGSLSAQGQEFFESYQDVFLRSDVNDPEYRAIVEAMVNANTPETAMMLLNSVNEEDIEGLGYISGHLETMLSPKIADKEKKLPTMSVHTQELYQPNLYIPLEKRSQNEKWNEVVAAIAKKFTPLVNNNSLPDYIKKSLMRTSTKGLRFLQYKEGKNDKVESMVKKPMEKVVVKTSHSHQHKAVSTGEEASINDQATPNENSLMPSYSWYYLLVGLIIVLVIVLIKRR